MKLHATTVVLALSIAATGSQAQDSDGDGVLDADDNCTLVANVDQVDTILDGSGNLCDADYNGDGVVGQVDFDLAAAAFGASEGDAHYDPDIDHDDSGTIGISDFSIFSARSEVPPGRPVCPAPATSRACRRCRTSMATVSGT